MAGYDDYQTEEEYIAASKRRVTMADTKELVAELRECVAPNWECETGSTEPITRSADALERLEHERDFEQSSRLTSEAQLGTLISNLEAELTTLRARVARLAEAAWFVRDHLAYTLAGPFGTAGEARAIAKIDAALTEEQP